jgi:tRNA(Ile)-lysidine synthase
MALESPDSVGTVSPEAFCAAMAQFNIRPGAAIAIAVSGGADSLALAILLSHWAGHHDIHLHALTVDHQLRDDAAAEAKQVGEWLSARSILHTVLRWDEGIHIRDVGASPQQAARDARYRLMSEWCEANSCAHLFVAHHADDQVETFLMRLARGSGVEGLAAMSPMVRHGSVCIARPLLDFTKLQLIGVCRAHDQTWIEDPSNESDKSTRVRFRQAQEMLEREGFTRHRLLATARHMRRAKAALDHAVTQLLEQACTVDDYGVARMTVQALVRAPEEIALRCLSRVLSAVSGSAYGPRFANLEGLNHRIVSEPWRDATLHGCIIARDGANLIVCRESAQISCDMDIAVESKLIWDGRYRVSFGSRDDSRLGTNFKLSPLTRIAWQTLRRCGASSPLEKLHPRIRASLPAIFDSAGLAAVPHAGYVRDDLQTYLHSQVELVRVFGSSLPI